MTTKIKWRLSKLPTPSELAELVKDKIITKEEAHEVLFDQVTEEDVGAEALKKEIEFLRKVVEDLSKSRSEQVRVIEKHIHNYPQWGWYGPYLTYCSSANGGAITTQARGSNSLVGSGLASTAGYVSTQATTLTDLKTF